MQKVLQYQYKINYVDFLTSSFEYLMCPAYADSQTRAHSLQLCLHRSVTEVK